MQFEKKNHHYVPQYWLRGFRDAENRLYKITNGVISGPVSTRSIMKEDWLYTLFDSHFNPSDNLENVLSNVEGEDARLFQRLNTVGYSPTEIDRDELCGLLALQACRHPDVLRRGNRLAKDLGALLANVHDLSLEQFRDGALTFGLSHEDVQDCYPVLLTRSREELSEELTELVALSPQSPSLPVQDALRAFPVVQKTIERMELIILDVLPPNAFVIGDTPLPQSDLASGFSVPLSKSLAVLAIPTGSAQSTLKRRPADPDEVAQINRTQYENSAETVAGPSASLLAALVA